MKKNIAVLFTTCVLLTGCNEDRLEDLTQTVDWYKEHQAERLDMIAKCKNNPGELSATPNCVNASHAASSLMWSSRKGIEVKPLTVDDFR